MTKQMVTLSAFCHAIVFTIATLGIPDLFSGPDASATIIPVELVEIGDETKITTRRAEPRERPTPPPRPEPTPVRQDAVPPPPLPDAIKPDTVEPRPTERARPRARPERERQPDFDLTQIAALLDKNREPEPITQVSEVEPDRAIPVQALQSSVTDAARFTLSERDALKAQLFACWNVPAGALDAENLVIEIQVALNRDGTLARAPRLSPGSLRRMEDPFFRVAAESALRAVRKCEPLKLPPEKYQEWRELILRFDPGDMLS